MLIGYVIMTCRGDNCGISYAVPKDWHEQKVRTNGSFYCPNGCSRKFCGETEEDKLRRENQRLKQNEAYLHDRIRAKDERLDQEKHKVTAYKGHVTRIKNRVSHGVCPCCNRTFQDLARHMATKHKDYKKEKVVA